MNKFLSLSEEELQLIIHNTAEILKVILDKKLVDKVD